MLRKVIFAIAAFAVALMILSDPDETEYDEPPQPPQTERCFATFAGGELQQVGMDVNFWEYSNEDGKGRVVCSLSPRIANGRVLETTPTSYLLDAGECVGWVSKIQVTGSNCQ